MSMMIMIRKQDHVVIVVHDDGVIYLRVNMFEVPLAESNIEFVPFFWGTF